MDNDNILMSGAERILLAAIVGDVRADKVAKAGWTLQRLAERPATCKLITPKQRAQITAHRELLEQALFSEIVRESKVSGPRSAEIFLKAKLGTREHEIFACLFLDTQNRVLKFTEMFRGTIDSCSVPPREVVKEAMTLNAAAVILVHNHPSGEVKASQADIRITRKLQKALELVNVRVLDHMIIGQGKTYSFSDDELL